MMTIGEKIKKFRTAKEFSQKQLAIMSGMSEPAIRNYELGNRQPSAKQIEKIAAALELSPFALSDPDFHTLLGVMHSLFELEDMYDLQITEIDGEVCLRLDKHSKASHGLTDRFTDWKNEADRLKRGEISKDEYDAWRYSYPRMEAERQKESRDERRNKDRKDG